MGWGLLDLGLANLLEVLSDMGSAQMLDSLLDWDWRRCWCRVGSFVGSGLGKDVGFRDGSGLGGDVGAEVGSFVGSGLSKEVGVSHCWVLRWQSCWGSDWSIESGLGGEVGVTVYDPVHVNCSMGSKMPSYLRGFQYFHSKHSGHALTLRRPT